MMEENNRISEKEKERAERTNGISSIPRVDGRRTLVVADMENIIISCVEKWGKKTDFQVIERYLSEKYNLVEKVGFCSSTRMNGSRRDLEKLGWQIQNVRTRSEYPDGSTRVIKNGLDIELALYTFEYVINYKPDRVVLISGDGDYVPLVTRLIRRAIVVEAISVDESMSCLLKKTVTDYISYEDIIGSLGLSVREEKNVDIKSRTADELTEPFNLLVKHLVGKKQYAFPPYNAASFKKTLKQDHPEFEERKYGFFRFHHLLEAARKKGLIGLYTDERGYWITPIDMEPDCLNSMIEGVVM